MKFFSKPLAAMAALIGMANAAAAAPSALALKGTSCLTRPEAEAVIAFAMPTLITGIADKCRPALASGGYLPGNATSLAARYRPLSNSAWPTARTAFQKISGEQIPAFLDDNTLRTLFEAGLSGALTDQVSDNDCKTVDHVLEAVAPLPPENMSRLVVLLIEASASRPQNAQQNRTFRLCTAG